MSFNVVIVGAGIVGSSIAFHLASRGVDGIALIERNLPGTGSTSKATGGFRHQFASRLNVQLSIESAQAFDDFHDAVGVNLDIRRVGYLFVSDDPKKALGMQQGVALQRSLGVDVSLLTRSEVNALVPGLSTAGLVTGTYSPRDGIINPSDACAGFLRAATRLGVELRPNCSVFAVLVKGNKIAGVQTDAGKIRCGVVVLATGVWTPAVAATVGVRLPIRPQRRQVYVTEGDAGLSQNVPLTVDLDTGAYFHREGVGLVIGGTDDGNDSGFDDRLDWSLVPTLAEALIRRLPTAANVSVRSGWAGLREMTPDGHGLVGEIAGIEGLLIAAGFSGHGFMHSPAVGRIIADLIVKGRCDVPDITPLLPLRFGDVFDTPRGDSYSF